MKALEIRILGPIEVVGPEGTIGLRGRLAALLTCLVVDRGRAVAIDTLAELVFDGEPPPGAVSTLHGYIHRLRRRVPGAVESSPAGYRLASGTLVDADLFEVERSEALAAIRAGQPDRARAMLEAALGRWRGRAYDSLSDRAHAQPEAVRLEELRRESEDDYLDLRCSTEVTHRNVADLEASVRAEPGRERRWALLISALQRSGRTSDATSAANRYRSWLREEFDVEPTSEFEVFVATLSPSATRPDSAGAPDACSALIDGARAALDAVPSIPLGVVAEVAFDAARGLIALHAIRLADDLYGRVIDKLGGLDPRRTIRARLGQAEIRARSSDPDWTGPLDVAVALARSLGDAELLVQAALLNPRGVATGSPNRIALLCALLRDIPPTNPDRLPLLAQHEMETGEEHRCEARRSSLPELLDTARATGNDQVRLQVIASALNDAGSFLLPEQRMLLASELDELSAQAGHGTASWLAAAHLYWAAVQQARAGAAAAALHMVEARRRMAAVIADHDSTEHLLAIGAYLAGDLDNAEAHLAAALPSGPGDDSGLGIDRANRDGVLLGLRREQGRIAEVLPLVSGDLPPFPRVVAASVTALVAAELGDVDAARSALTRCRAARHAPAQYLPHLRSLCLEAAALIGDSGRAAQEAELLRPHAGQVLCGTRGCDGAVDRYLGLAAAVNGDRGQCDRWLGSAVAIHERLGSPILLARTLYDRSRLLGDTSARDRALTIARRHGLVALGARLQ